MGGGESDCCPEPFDVFHICLETITKRSTFCSYILPPQTNAGQRVVTLSHRVRKAAVIETQLLQSMVKLTELERYLNDVMKHY